MSARRRWAALAMLVMPVLLISIDMSVLGVAVPALSADLDPTGSQLLWIIDLYSFLLAGLLVLSGSLGDRFGRKRLLMIGAPLFGAASVLAAFSTTPEMLIASRALLGIGGATLMPSTLGLLRSVFPDRRERQIAVAVWGSAFCGGSALGPVVGGILLEHFWWGSVFLMNAPIMLLFLVGGGLLLPESKDPEPGPFDLPSAALSILALLPLVYAMKSGVKDPSWMTAVAAVVGGVAAFVFIRRQLRLPNPMIDLGLFLRPGFAPAILINVLAVFAMLGTTFFFPQYLMLVHGMGSAQAGLWLLPLALAALVGTYLAPVLVRFMAVRMVVTSGTVVVTVGFLVATQLDVGQGMALFGIASVLIGAGLGLAQTLTNDVILTTAPPSRAGAASALSETGYELGGAMGTAALGTLGLAIYAKTLSAVDGVTSEQLDASRETLGAAHEVAGSLPTPVGDALRAESSAAFVTGMDTVIAVCVAVMVGAFFLAWRGLATPAVDGAVEQGHPAAPAREEVSS